MHHVSLHKRFLKVKFDSLTLEDKKAGISTENFLNSNVMRIFTLRNGKKGDLLRNLVWLLNTLMFEML